MSRVDIMTHLKAVYLGAFFSTSYPLDELEIRFLSRQVRRIFSRSVPSMSSFPHLQKAIGGTYSTSVINTPETAIPLVDASQF